MSGNPAKALGPSDDLRGEPFRFVNGTFYSKVSTPGILILDTFRTEPGGPPLHVHDDVDEWFEVREGRFRIRIGGVDHELGPGDSIFGPRRVEHGFVSLEPTGRLFIVYNPAGGMEAFFREGATRGKMTTEEFAALSAEYRMTVTGPPMPVDPV